MATGFRLVSILLLGATVAWAQEVPAPAESTPSPAEPETAPAASPSQDAAPPGSALEEIAEKVAALASGKAGADADPDALFSVPLGDASAVALRAQRLGTEIGGMQEALAKLGARLANVEKEVPPPQLPPAPRLTPEPVAPEPPAVKRPRRPTAVERKALEEHRAADEAYRAALDEHERSKAGLAEWSAAREAAEKARAEKITELRLRLRREKAGAKLRLALARHRLAYLSELAKLLSRLSPAARTALGEVASDRRALRSRSAQLLAVERSLSSLLGRTESLQQRATAGALLGFLAQREALSRQLGQTSDSLRELSESVKTTAADALGLAEGFESQGSALRRAILTAVKAPDRQRRIDAAFVQHLRSLRAVRRTVRDRRGDVDLADLGALRGAVDGLIADPGRFGSCGEAERAAYAVAGHIEELESALISERLGFDRWRLATERQAVTVLEPLASEQTRSRAYAPSAELLADLESELVDAWAQFRSWAASRRASLGSIREGWADRTRLLGYGRVAAALLVMILLFLLRRRTPQLVARGVARATRALKGHAGAIVRWAGLVQSVLPVCLFIAAGYMAMALIGFHHAEVQVAEVVFRWLVLYKLVGEALHGLTRRVSAGRPALIAMAPGTATLLHHTYARVGLMAALATIADRITGRWFGMGPLHSLVFWVALVWVACWALWATFAWRPVLGRAWLGKAEAGSSQARAAQFMVDHRLGALLTPVAFFRLLLAGVVAVLGKQGLLAYLRARSLRRLAKRPAVTTKIVKRDELPDEYVRKFPLYPILGEDAAVVLPRETQVERVTEQLRDWRATRANSSLVLVGEKGMGKTTLLGLLTQRLSGVEITFHTIGRKTISEAALVADLAPSFSMNGVDEVETLAKALVAGPERVVLLDEAHNVFLRTIDGHRGFEALIGLVNATSDRVFWVLSVNRFAWDFLNQSRGRVHYFRKLMPLATWAQTEVQELIARRNERAGLSVEFDDILLDGSRGADSGFSLVEGADGYFRLLWEASGGNPRLATYLWLQSLTLVSRERLRVGLFREPAIDVLEELGDEMLFALAAVFQHENLSPDELQQALNVSPAFASFALRYLREYGYLEPKGEDERRLTVAPAYYRQTLRYLRSRHLLFEVK